MKKLIIFTAVIVATSIVIFNGCSQKEPSIKDIKTLITPNDSLRNIIAVKIDSSNQNRAAFITKRMIDVLTNNGFAVSAIFLIGSKENFAGEVKEKIPWCKYYDVSTTEEFFSTLKPLLSESEWGKTTKKIIYFNFVPRGDEKDTLDSFTDQHLIDDSQQMIVK